MGQSTSSTNGKKRKRSCESNNKNDEMQETPNRDLAPEPSLKKMKTSEYTTVVFCYRKVKKINSNQLENDQS
ncbi:hypothetical protein H8957_016937, partial [Semnopithecus entellus]